MSATPLGAAAVESPDAIVWSPKAGSPRVATVQNNEVTSLPYSRFHELTPAQVPLLTPAQIATIPNVGVFANLSDAWRAQLTLAQVQSLRVDLVGLQYLTPTQRTWMNSPQITSLSPNDFKYLDKNQVPHLSTDQIASVQNDSIFRVDMANTVQFLRQNQIQAIRPRPDTVRINWMTPQQLSWLTTAQIQSVQLADFGSLTAAQVPLLTTAQIASVQDDFTFRTSMANTHQALTAAQIQAVQINGTDVRIDWMTPQQRESLTAAQVSKVIANDFVLLPASRIPLLTLDQVRPITVGSFAAWSAAARAAVTREQVGVMNVPDLKLQYFTPEQIGWLTPQQVASLSIQDLPRLTDAQIPFVTPEQFAQMTTTFAIGQFSDHALANLTREQLMALPLDVLSSVMSVERDQFPPEDYIPWVHHHIQSDGLPASHDTFAENAFRLTRLADATHQTVASGDWSNPATWLNGQVPGADARVFIHPGHTVRFDIEMTQAVKTVGVQGTLTFATNVNTALRVDTLVIWTSGKLHIGTAAAPMGDNVTAKIIIPDNGPIDTTWDPSLVGRGLISRGETRMYGRKVTSYEALAVDPMSGATTLQLAEAPTGWRVGDELVIAGVNPITDNYGSDRVRITAIAGTTVTLDRPLTYNHDAPDGYGLSIHVANMTRNIQFLSEMPETNDPVRIQQRPHIALVNNPNIKIENILVQGFGRTDKTRAINSPVVVNGVLQPGTGTNARARYAIHFHHTGVDPAFAPAEIRGSLVINSPGWGYVNHQSNVVMEENVAIDVVGSSFAGEDGNEIGVMRANLSLNSTGKGGHPLARKSSHDFGHAGYGFWLQGPGIELVDNIVAGARSAAYAYMTASGYVMFDAVNLADPTIAEGREAIPVGTVPLAPFRGNLAYASNQGLEIWFHQTNLTDGDSLIDDFTTWNTTQNGIGMFYTGHITIRDSLLLGRTNMVPPYGIGIHTNRITHDITLDNVQIEYFNVGLETPPRRATVIKGGRFANLTNIVIAKGHDTTRSVRITQPVTFVPLSSAQTGGAASADVVMKTASIDNLGRKAASLFSRDDVTMKLANGQTLTLYYADQRAETKPFPTAPTPTIADFPAAYAGKTNRQLQQQYGAWFNGGDVPAGASTPPRIVGYAVATTPPPPPPPPPTTVTGDFDGNSRVDGSDFLAWQRGLGTSNATVADGDADGDRDVDRNDLMVWADQFPASGTAVVDAAAAPALMAPPLVAVAPSTKQNLVYLAMANDQLAQATTPRKDVRPRYAPPRRQ